MHSSCKNPKWVIIILNCIFLYLCSVIFGNSTTKIPYMKTLQPNKIRFADKHSKQMKNAELFFLIITTVSLLLHILNVGGMIDIFAISGFALFLIYFLWSYQFIPNNEAASEKKINVFLSDYAYQILVKISKLILSFAYFAMVIYVSGFNDSLLNVVRFLTYLVPALIIFNVLYKVYGKPSYNVAYWSFRIILCALFLYYISYYLTSNQV